jgi:hypothetical protein
MSKGWFRVPWFRGINGTTAALRHMASSYDSNEERYAKLSSFSSRILLKYSITTEDLISRNFCRLSALK